MQNPTNDEAGSVRRRWLVRGGITLVGALAILFFWRNAGEAAGDVAAGVEEGGCGGSLQDESTRQTRSLKSTTDALPATSLGGFTDRGFVLNAANGSFPYGVGAPSVVYVPPLTTPYGSSASGGRYTMFVDAQRDSGWGIYRSTSTDGITWTPPDPVFVDLGAALSGASVSQPSVVFVDDTWHMALKGISIAGTNGIYYASSRDGIRWTVKTTPIATDRGGSDLGNPSTPIGDPAIEYRNHVGRVAFTLGTKIYLATSTDAFATFTVAATPIASPSGTSTGVGGSVLACDTAASDQYYHFFYTLGANPTYTKTFSLQTSWDGVTWTHELPLSIDGLPSDVSHWDVLPVQNGFIVYYSATNSETGSKAIGMASTVPKWSHPTCIRKAK